MILAAMLGMALLVASPAMAQGEVSGDENIVEQCAAVLNQVNEGSQYAVGGDQDANQNQYQYQNDDEDEEDTPPELQGDDGNQYQYGSIDQTQGDQTATGSTFDAEQVQYCSNVV